MADLIGPGGGGLKRLRALEGDDESVQDSERTSNSQEEESGPEEESDAEKESDAEDLRDAEEDIDDGESLQLSEADSEDSPASRRPLRLPRSSGNKSHGIASALDFGTQDGDDLETTIGGDTVTKNSEREGSIADAHSNEEDEVDPDIKQLAVDVNLPTTASTEIATKYMPPQLRAAHLQERAEGDKRKAEERMKLERKAQGLLNK